MILRLDIPDHALREKMLRKHLPVVREGGAVVVAGAAEREVRAAVFDLDGTLIPCEFMDEIAERRGVAHLTRHLTGKAMAGEMDFRTSYEKRLALLEGTPVALLEEVIADMPLARGAIETIAALKTWGVYTAIVTGGCARLGRAIQSRLGVDALYATELEERDGRLTGRTASRLLDGEGKVLALRDFCAQNGVTTRQAMAVGDGANDIAMLAWAGVGVLHRGTRPLDEILEWCL